LKNDLDFLNVADIGGRDAFHDHQVGLFADGNRADARILAEKLAP